MQDLLLKSGPIIPKPKGQVLAYGTAGFRADASILASTFHRMGMLAGLRSSQRKGLITGVMVTASHNKAADNGVKLVDTDGGMLEQSWEVYATDLANAEDDKVGDVLESICSKEGIPLNTLSTANVYIGRDTRVSSKMLSDLTFKGIESVGGKAFDYGELTTPQLHHIVKMKNEGKEKWASEEGYHAMLNEAYIALVSSCPIRKESLFIDCAHGVGALKFPKVQSDLSKFLDIKLFNTGDGELNYHCGAEHVQKTRSEPLNTVKDIHKGHRMASIDGDSDRLVYWFIGEDNNFHLLDGDAIAVLAGRFIFEQCEILGLKDELSIGVVQTAYANGASSIYLKSKGVPLGMAKTGVKYVHHEALHYDVGIYFEANGHGTVLFNEKVVNKLKGMNLDLLNTDQRLAHQRLTNCIQLINQAVGDAISDLLLVEAILSIYQWKLEDWLNLYTDLPSRQSKIKVKDRNVVKTIPDETRTTAPEGLQASIDHLVSKFELSRAFVRPSGTEDAVRIYAEAKTQEQADLLALQVAQTLYDFSGGIGGRPI